MIKEIIERVAIKTIIFTIMILIPIAQIYAWLIALPLFMISSRISQNSDLMGYTFGYGYPKSPLTVLIFFIYYLIFFFIWEYIQEKISLTYGKELLQKVISKRNKIIRSIIMFILFVGILYQIYFLVSFV